MPSIILTRSDIANNLTRAAFEKAKSYYAQQRVTNLQIGEDGSTISARVRGSGQQIYNVDIVLEGELNEGDSIDGNCSCPVGYNCKHVGATLLAALGDRPALVHGAVPARRPRAPAPPPPVPAPPVSALPYEVSNWLDRIGLATRGDTYPPDVTQRLLYIVRPKAEGHRAPRLAVSLLSVRLLKGGEFSDKHSQVKLSNFEPDRAPKFYRDADIEIIRGLLYRSGYNYDGVHEISRLDLLEQIVATGRAYWLKPDGVPLRWGAPREGRIDWQLASAEGLRPFLVIDDAIGLNAEPPAYADEAAGLVGPVELGMPARLARQLLQAPVISPVQVELVARRLGEKLPGIRDNLLPSAPEPPRVITQAATPVLHLEPGRRIPYYNYYGYHHSDVSDMPVARLGFRYGPIEIGQSETAPRLQRFHEGQIYDIVRQPTKERAALKRLRNLGFTEARRIHSALDLAHQNDFSLPDRMAWLDFLSRGAEGLRAEGFEIDVAGDFPYQLASSSGEFDAEIESSGIDWFELAVGIDIEGQRVDLAPALAQMIAAPGFNLAAVEASAENGDNIYLPLADGRLLALAAARFLPLLVALHMLKPGGVFAVEAGRLKLSRPEIVPLLGIDGAGFRFVGADNLRQLAEQLRGIGRSLPEPELPAGFSATLRPYQAQGVAWLDLLRGCGLGGILADDMGLGKTVQMLALLAMEKARGHATAPSLVVVPTSLLANWSNEARRFASDLKLLVLHGSARKQAFAEIDQHDIVLTTYPLLARDHETLLARDWHMAILDEAQTIKNPNAATTRWLYGIKARQRFCLTGTPMENHLGELWSLMSFVNPGYLGDKTGFAREWRTPIEKRGDIARAQSLARRVKPFLLRRTKAMVATELPAKTEIVENVALEGRQRDLYDSIRLAMSAKVRKAISERGLGKSHIIVLEALLRLRQVCCDPQLLKLDDGIERASAKLERLMEMVEELRSEGRKIIIFSQFTAMLELIRRRLDAVQFDYSLLTGNTKDRPAAINAFQGGATDIFLISLKAGGVGLNLTAADTVIIYDPWWNPAVEDQAIDRAHRIGQDKPVFVYRLTAAGTIEEKMDALKARKRALADGLFDRQGQVAAALTEEDVTALFAD